MTKSEIMENIIFPLVLILGLATAMVAHGNSFETNKLNHDVLQCSNTPLQYAHEEKSCIKICHKMEMPLQHDDVGFHCDRVLNYSEVK